MGGVCISLVGKTPNKVYSGSVKLKSAFVSEDSDKINLLIVFTIYDHTPSSGTFGHRRLGAAVWTLEIWAPDIWAPGLSGAGLLPVFF